MAVGVISWLAGAIRETQMSSLCKLDPSVPRCKLSGWSWKRSLFFSPINEIRSNLSNRYLVFFNFQWGLIVKKHTPPVHVSPSLYLFLCLLGWIDFLSIIFCVPWLRGRGDGLKASVCDIAQELKSQLVQYKTSWSFSHGFSRLVWSVFWQIASWQWVTVQKQLLNLH